MKVFVTRTKIAGGSGREYAYDVLVPLSELPDWLRPNITHTSITENPDGESCDCVSYSQATQSQEHIEMTPSIERLEDWERHDKKARMAATKIVSTVFPEFSSLRFEYLPILWVTFPEEQKFGSSRRWVENA